MSSMIIPFPKSAQAAAIVCQGVHHAYGERAALRGVDLRIGAGEIFALLGPNGSGKTTLFRLLSTLVPVQRGRIEVAGLDVASDPLAVRGTIGIVFQSPSLDKKLTVDENIACQAALYGLSGDALRKRRDEVLAQLKLTERRGEFCETLSGGLRRRVELAKGILHRPQVMLLDEPSTGLDPSARIDLWQTLRSMADEGISVVLTTHLLEEAEKSDRLAIMFEGQVIAEGTPDSLRGEMGDGVISIQSGDLDGVESTLRQELGLDPQRVAQQLRVRCADAPGMVPRIAQTLGDRMQSISVGRPGLEDVFIAKTGHRFD
jgi:ABC-2 type transport system ATP-binding protein